VRRRLVAAIAGVTALALLLFAIPLGVVLGHHYRDEDLLRLQRDTVAATRGIDIGGRGDPIELPRDLQADQLAVYDRAGRRLAGQGPATAPDLVRSAIGTNRTADAAAGGQLVVAVPLLSGERVVGAIRAQRDDRGARADAHGAWLVLAAVAAGILVVATIAAVLLAGWLSRPLERLARAARRLGAGDFSARSPRSGIDEVDAVAAALDGTAGQLAALVARERAFTADASHQLRTPLQAARIELEAMELRGIDAPEVAAALAQVDRLQATIDTLLTIARDESLPDARTDPGASLSALADRWTEPLAHDGRPLRLRRDAGGEKLSARATPAVVDEILDVLVDNAHRHGAGEVTVSVRELDRWIAIDVADAGPGLGEDPEAAFVRRSSEAAGHGIGLALARTLAHAEGGRLSARTSGGAVFTLMLRAAGDGDRRREPAARGA
jgi:signal transduction histidine kinase